MEMPKPGPEHDRLNVLVGSWRGEETLHPSPWDAQGATAQGRFDNRLDLDGFAVVQDYVQERDGQVTFRGHGVFTWDQPAGEYVLYWFDSIGMPPNRFRGRFEGDVLTLVDQTPMGHHRVRFDMTESAKGRHGFHMEMSQDGDKWQPLMDGSYTRI